MRKKIETFTCLVVVVVLAGCCRLSPVAKEQEHSHVADNVDTTRRDELIAMLNKPTAVSELTPYKLEGKLIYYIGTSFQKPTPTSKESFNRIEADMTIEQLVDTLGPGFSCNDVGIAFISWHCEDGRKLHLHMNIRKLDQIPKKHKQRDS